MAVGAEEHALRGLGAQLTEGTDQADAAQLKALRGRIEMVERERPSEPTGIEDA